MPCPARSKTRLSTLGFERYSRRRVVYRQEDLDSRAQAPSRALLRALLSRLESEPPPCRGRVGVPGRGAPARGLGRGRLARRRSVEGREKTAETAVGRAHPPHLRIGPLAVHLRDSDASALLHHRASRRQEDPRAPEENRARPGPSAARPRVRARSSRLRSHASLAIYPSASSVSVRPADAPKHTARPNGRPGAASSPR